MTEQRQKGDWHKQIIEGLTVHLGKCSSQMPEAEGQAPGRAAFLDTGPSGGVSGARRQEAGSEVGFEGRARRALLLLFRRVLWIDYVPFPKSTC